ncbi:MAG: hypothetical protein JNL74_24515 [Fibrobacteres bacterium]|nr:hypothetical protein [Fibrobacterota bacterium]
MKIILINPWITDFKAYDEWMRPYPLYQLMSRFGNVHEFKLIDCLSGIEKRKKNGSASFQSIEIDKPDAYKIIPRKYKRYGISVKEFQDAVLAFGKPDLVQITTLMTYWYPGVKLAVDVVKEIYPDVHIQLGGIYANLLPQHAGNFASVGNNIYELYDNNETLTNQHKLLTSNELRCVMPIRMIKGCPDNCTYCSAALLNGPGLQFTELSDLIIQLEYFIKTGGKQIVFYDDASLVNFDKVLKPLLLYIIDRGMDLQLNFPNGVHARMITEEVATLLFAAGTKTIRLGYERKDEKISSKAFTVAAANLVKAGFKPTEVGAYLLIGLSKDLNVILEDARFITECGLGVHLNQLSPVPGSEFYKQIIRQFPEVATEPLLQNDMSFIFTHMGFDWNEVFAVKEEIRTNQSQTIT